jgi:hypothetical protein
MSNNDSSKHQKRPSTFMAYLQYLMTIGRRQWAVNSRSVGDSEMKGDPAGTKASRESRDLSALNILAPFQNNLIQKKALCGYSDVVAELIKICLDASPWPEPIRPLHPIGMSDEDYEMLIEDMEADLDAEEGFHRVDHLVLATNNNPAKISFASFGIKGPALSAELGNDSSIRFRKLRELVDLVASVAEEASRAPKTIDGQASSQDMNLQQWNSYVASQAKRREDVEEDMVEVASGNKKKGPKPKKRKLSGKDSVDGAEEEEVKVPARPARPAPMSGLANLKPMADGFAKKFELLERKEHQEAEKTQKVSAARLTRKATSWLADRSDVMQAALVDCAVDDGYDDETAATLFEANTPEAHELICSCLKGPVANLYRNAFVKAKEKK